MHEIQAHYLCGKIILEKSGNFNNCTSLESRQQDHLEPLVYTYGFNMARVSSSSTARSVYQYLSVEGNYEKKLCRFIGLAPSFTDWPTECWCYTNGQIAEWWNFPHWPLLLKMSWHEWFLLCHQRIVYRQYFPISTFAARSTNFSESFSSFQYST